MDPEEGFRQRAIIGFSRELGDAHAEPEAEV